MFRALPMASWVSAVAIFVLAPAVLPQQLKAGAQSSAGSNGVISGRVLNSSGEPLAAANVYARSLSGNAPRKAATTDSHGDFKIEGLEPSLYTVSASMPGYLFSFSPAPGDPPTYYHVGDSVTLTLSKGGVITGSVTGSNGPLIGIGVFATRVRDSEGKRLAASPGFPERRTDDRGVFRFYGLAPGAYILAAARPSAGTILPSAYDNDVPTYFPSATRDTASEIIVREGDEVAADIRYRAEPGHAVSGRLFGVIQQPQFSSGTSIVLTDVRDHTDVANVGPDLADESSFAIYGVPDGEYEVTARQFLPTREQLRSQPRRVSVNGANVTGITLTLAPLASIDGRLVFESDPEAACVKRKDSAAQETIVYARRYDPENKTGPEAGPDASKPSLSSATYLTYAIGDAKGSFSLRNLPPGSYQIDARAPASGWYAKSVTMTPARSSAKIATIGHQGRDGISVTSGERISGLTVTIAEGAATLRGHISLAAGQSLSAKLRVYLIPAEREHADNILRFYETRPDADRSFTIDNLAPGRYLIVARLSEENDFGAAKSIRQDGAFRAKVVHDADAFKKDLVFKPCEQLADYQLPYSPPTSSQ